MEFYAKIYHFYRTALARTARLFIFTFLLILVLYLFANHQSPKIPEFLFNCFVMSEIFFHFKISKMMPSVPTEKNNGQDIFQSFTMQALYGFIVDQKSPAIIRRLLSYPQVKLILEKSNLSHKDISFKDVDKKILSKTAFEVCQTFKGKFVTTVDVFVAYLFVTENDTKLLFSKQLKSEDLYNLVYWARLEYPEEEKPIHKRIHFSGAGIGDSFVTGWTPETKKYTSDFSSVAINEEPVIRGREKEFTEMLEGLVKVENNNVLFVGDIGSGKENLVRAFAYHSFAGNIGQYLNYKKVLELMIGPLSAGAENRSDLESRLQNVIAEISHSTNVIIYLPEFQNILGASAYGIDISGALLPYLKVGDLPIIATITSGNYKTYMERNSLREAFTVIQLPEPDKDTAFQMVLSDARSIEKKYRIILSYRAVVSAVELADRFFEDEVLPGSAVTLLENVANTVAGEKRPSFEHTHAKVVLESDVVSKVEQTTNVPLSMPSGDEINLLLHLEDKLHERVIDQDHAISAIAEAMRRLRSGLKTENRPISFLFLGPTGVGKTETAKALADLYYGGEKNMIRLDMSEFANDDGLKRLLGASPGQGTERGDLTDKIHDHPSSLVLLDEFEKAHSSIHNLFLQVLDDGRLTDNKGTTVSFRDAIIIATSNAGSEYIREEVQKGNKVDKTFQKKLMNYLQSNNLFKPELLNRFDDVIMFKPLGPSESSQIILLLLNQVKQTLLDQDITLLFDDAVIEKITKEGVDSEFGARPLRRYIQDNIEDLIAQKKLTNELIRGKTARFSIDGTGALILSVT